MQEIKFDEAMELCLQGGRDDICVMQPQLVVDMPLRQVRELAEAGAVFAVLGEEVKPPVLSERPVDTRKKKVDIGKMEALRAAKWPYKKIAAELGCAESTVWNHFNKGTEGEK